MAEKIEGLGRIGRLFTRRGELGSVFVMEPLKPPYFFAHRGARAYKPENTIHAFQHGLELGATGLETDAWLTADGHVVLDHDGKVRRWLRRSLPISSHLREALAPHIPTLDELFESCGTDFQLSIDVKDPEGFDPIVEVLRSRYPQMLEKTWLCIESLDLLTDWSAKTTGVKLIQSTRLSRMKEGPEARAAALSAAGVDGINLRINDWNLGLTTLFHRFDLRAFAWDTQHNRELHDAFSYEVDAVYCDFPDRMLKAWEETQR